MYQPDGAAATAKKIGGVILVVVVGSLAAGIAKVGTRDAIDYFRTSPSAVETRIQQSIRDNPQYAPLYNELKADFPADYQRLITEFSNAARAGQTSGEVALVGRTFMRKFMASQKANVAKAPAKPLADALDAQIRVIELLSKESPYMCAQFATTGLSSQPPVSIQSAMGSAAALIVTAAARGRDNPVNRSQPTDRDWQMLVEQMRGHGVPDSDIQHMATDTTGAMSTDAQCALGLALYRSLGEIDPESSARLSAAILVPST